MKSFYYARPAPDLYGKSGAISPWFQIVKHCAGQVDEIMFDFMAGPFEAVSRLAEQLNTTL